MDNFHLAISSELRKEFLAACFSVYESRNSIPEFEKDAANDILKNLILHSLDTKVSYKYTQFIQDDCNDTEDAVVGYKGSVVSQTELVFQIILFWNHLLTMIKPLHACAEILLSDIRDLVGENFDEDCEAALFVNSDEDLVDRFEHGSRLVQLSHRVLLLFQLETVLSQKVLGPLVNMLLCSAYVNDVLSEKLSVACRRQETSREQKWNPIYHKIKLMMKTLHSNFLLRYGNKTIRLVEDAVLVVPSERTYLTAKATKQKRLDALAAPIYRPAKKPRPQVDIYELEVDEQVKHRCEEQTANRMLNYFGAAKVEELDVRKWYKSYYSKTYGNIIILEGFGTEPVGKNSRNNQVELPSVTPSESPPSVNTETDGTPSNVNSTKKCDPEWTSRILTALRLCVDRMSIYTDESHHVSFDQSFEDYVRLQLDGQYFPRQVDYIHIHFSHHEVATCRRSLTSELHTYITRLFREYKLFNPRILSGGNLEDYSDFHTRFIMYKVLTDQLKGVDQSHNKIEAQIALLEDFVCQTSKLTLNTGLVLCLTVRSIILWGTYDDNSVLLLVNFWMDIIDSYFTIVSSDDTSTVCAGDQVHILRLFVCLNVVTPISSHYLVCSTAVKTGIDQNNEDNFDKHMHQQSTNIITLNLVCRTTNQIVIKNTKNKDLYLCCLATHSAIIKHWWIGCIHKFTVRNKTENNFTNMIVSVFPNEFVNATIKLLAHCFLYEPNGCYVTSIRLTCALICFIKQWAFDCNVTAASCIATAWSSCKVYKTIFQTLTTYREKCMTSVHAIVAQIIPELNYILMNNVDSKETEGYTAIETACKDVQYVLDLNWFL